MKRLIGVTVVAVLVVAWVMVGRERDGALTEGRQVLVPAKSSEDAASADTLVPAGEFGRQEAGSDSLPSDSDSLPSDDAGVTLWVKAKQDHSPIDAAEVWTWPADITEPMGPILLARADRLGRCVLSAPRLESAESIAIRASGFVTAIVDGVAPSIESTVLLERGGEIAVVCREVDGSPIVGVAAVLSYGAPLGIESAYRIATEERHGRNGVVAQVGRTDGEGVALIGGIDERLLPAFVNVVHPGFAVVDSVPSLGAPVPLSGAVDVTLDLLNAVVIDPIGMDVIGSSVHVINGGRFESGVHWHASFVRDLLQERYPNALIAVHPRLGALADDHEAVSVEIFDRKCGWVRRELGAVPVPNLLLGRGAERVESACVDEAVTRFTRVSFVAPTGTMVPVSSFVLVDGAGRYFELRDGGQFLPEQRYAIRSLMPQVSVALSGAPTVMAGDDVVVPLSAEIVSVRMSVFQSNGLAVEAFTCQVISNGRATMQVVRGKQGELTVLAGPLTVEVQARGGLRGTFQGEVSGLAREIAVVLTE